MSKNNLFKLLFVTLFAFAATAFTGCSDDNDELTSAPVLVATPTSLSFGEEGGTRQIAIEANCAWTVNASTLEGWADVTPLSGEGSGTLTVTTYESTAAHQGVITFSLIHEYYGKWGKAETSIAVKQTVDGGVDPIGDALYEENCGSTTFKKGDGWPLTSAYDGWQRGGTLDQSGVVYGGTNSSVRCSGSDYDDNTVSGAPYIVVKTLEISKVNIASNTNFTFQFVAQNTASTASESPYTPTFGDITASSFKFEVGVNGTWYPAEFSVMALNGSAAWHQCTAMFKLPADVQTGELAFRWSGFSGGTTLRVDDLKLYEGGEGAVLGGGETPGPGDGYTFTKVSTVTSGKQYLIVADGKKAKYISAAHGYLQVDPVSDIEGKITVTSLEDAFTLTAADGGYTILQSDNRYLIQTGDFNSYNVDAAPAEGQIFSIEPQSDGSFKILNTNVNKYMQFDAQYSSFGSYSDARGTMPFLYELGEGGSVNPGPGPDPTGGVTIDLSKQGFVNAESQDGKSITEGGYTLTFAKAAGGTNPSWYDSGSAFRLYASNTLTVTGGTLKTIELVFAEKEYDFNKITTDVPTYTEPKWEGSATSVTFTVDGVRGEGTTSEKGPGSQGGNRRIVKVIINGGGQGGNEPVNPDPGKEGTISAITSEGTYTVAEAIVAATYKNGFLIEDETGAILVYQQVKDGPAFTVPAVGTKLSVSGKVTTYGGMLQFSNDTNNSLVLTEKGSASVQQRTPVVLDAAAADALKNAPKPTYIKYTGTLTVSGNYYNVAIPGATIIGSLQYPNDNLNAASFNGKSIEVVGWHVGCASNGKYLNTMVVTLAGEGETPTPAEPKVTTAAYQNLTAESVTLGGSFEGFAAAPAEAGVEYLLFATGTVNDLDWATATKVKAASVASPFTVAVTGLTAETQYAYRAYAGDVYGEPMTFVTPAASTPDPTGKSVALTAADIAKIGGSYADFSLTAADGSAWSGYGMLSTGYLQLGWNTDTSKNASKCYVLTPEVSGTITTISITPDSANKTYNDRVFAALPADFVYTGQSVDEVKAAAYAYSANTVQGSADPLTIDLKGKNLKQVVIRAVGGACYVADIKVEFE